VASVGAFTTVSTPAAAADQVKKEKPLKGTVRYKRVGGYSYKYQDTIMSPSEAKRFWDPPSQSISGPFDSGFFFDSAQRPNGGDAPYMQ
jgi:hypothetical protein